jgi:hypothetical protein
MTRATGRSHGDGRKRFLPLLYGEKRDARSSRRRAESAKTQPRASLPRAIYMNTASGTLEIPPPPARRSAIPGSARGGGGRFSLRINNFSGTIYGESTVY